MIDNQYKMAREFNFDSGCDRIQIRFHPKTYEDACKTVGVSQIERAVTLCRHDLFKSVAEVSSIFPSFDFKLVKTEVRATGDCYIIDVTGGTPTPREDILTELRKGSYGFDRGRPKF